MADSMTISKTKEPAPRAEERTGQDEDYRVRVSPEMHHRFKVRTTQLSVSMKDAIDEAIEMWLKSKKAGAA